MWFTATENIALNNPVLSTLKLKRLTVCFDYFRTSTVKSDSAYLRI